MKSNDYYLLKPLFQDIYSLIILIFCILFINLITDTDIMLDRRLTVFKSTIWEG
jgi:hypothetical protein